MPVCVQCPRDSDVVASARLPWHAIDATTAMYADRGAASSKDAGPAPLRVEVGPEAAVLVPHIALEPFQRGRLAAARVEEVASRIDGRVAVAQVIQGRDRVVEASERRRRRQVPRPRKQSARTGVSAFSTDVRQAVNWSLKGT